MALRDGRPDERLPAQPRASTQQVGAAVRHRSSALLVVVTPSPSLLTLRDARNAVTTQAAARLRALPRDLRARLGRRAACSGSPGRRARSARRCCSAALVPRAARVRHADARRGAATTAACCWPSSSCCRCSTCWSATAPSTLFTVFIPVYVFLAIPVVSALGQRPEALPRAQREDPVGHHGLRLRHEPCAGAAAARPSRLRRPRRVPGASSWCSSSPPRRSAQEVGQPAPAPAARSRARSADLLVARLAARRRRAPALVGALLFWITPFKPLAALAMGADRRRRRHARRVRDEGAEARRRRAQLGRRGLGHRRGRPARPRRAALLRGAGVLPFRALVFPAVRARRPVASRILGIDPGLRTTGFGVDRLRRPRAALRRQRHDQHRRGRRAATCRRG